MHVKAVYKHVDEIDPRRNDKRFGFQIWCLATVLLIRTFISMISVQFLLEWTVQAKRRQAKNCKKM